MSGRRTGTLALLGFVLVIVLAAGTPLFAAHQTVLDPGYVSETLEEEGVYAEMADGGLPGAGGSSGNTGDSAGPFEQAAIMDEAMTESYVAEQMDANVDRLYAYLHGERDDLALYVDTEPLRENAANASATRVRETEPGALFASVLAGQHADAPIEPQLAVRLDEGPSEFRAAQDEFEQRVRDRVVSRMAEHSFETASDDERLALVIEDYDPDDYSEAEKAAMVDDRRAEILRAFETKVREDRADEVDDAVESELDALREDGTAGDPATRFETDRAAAAATDLESAVIDGLTGESDYETYRADATDARDAFAAAASGELDARLDGAMPERIDLTEGMGAEQREVLQRAATAVQWLDRLAIALPVVALGLIGLVWYVSRSIGRTAGTVGWSALVAGATLFVGIVAARYVMAERFGVSLASPDVAPMAVLDGYLATVQAGSLWLVGPGIVLVGVALARRYELDRAIRAR